MDFMTGNVCRYGRDEPTFLKAERLHGLPLLKQEAALSDRGREKIELGKKFIISQVPHLENCQTESGGL
jgi:hypothetical protein